MDIIETQSLVRMFLGQRKTAKPAVRAVLMALWGWGEGGEQLHRDRSYTFVNPQEALARWPRALAWAPKRRAHKDGRPQAERAPAGPRGGA